MFTGIVAAVGKVVDVSPLQGGSDEAGVRLTIQAPGFSLAATRLGDSIAIQGACMTVVEFSGNTFKVDVSRESLNLTTGLDTAGEVNLEHALKLGDSLDGHLVSGHVDGLGKVTHFEPVGESWDLRIHVPAKLAKYLAYKGSITVNGVSLTVNQVDDQADGCEIRINLIPHTVQVTTLKNLRAGTPVNLEIDMIARYVERMMGAQLLRGK
ncbi:riboflavin synthase [Eoetvoesiella caeni]|uniref:Riboflavin synthase n=1 Tax=Eoetvoesiella caeni TaxID=645616 RepID=A0A366HDR1_9BURK|nr:riboflavin synthase [Eoetvoesiella caeni]MCI2809038.1 riboflavin synthase [Eoetvoesiella caeni]NYT55461.1 riboflavin synthase [Eoetvoesiella caeni]RBP40016.1 riboflavin synthase alpha chain [Eoetvoesiella caeni]